MFVVTMGSHYHEIFINGNGITKTIISNKLTGPNPHHLAPGSILISFINVNSASAIIFPRGPYHSRVAVDGSSSRFIIDVKFRDEFKT